MSIFVFDFETTGTPNKQHWPGHQSQPYIVQIGALVIDTNDVERGAMSMIIKPDGWEITEEVAKWHGITQEIAMRYGVPLDIAMRTFVSLAALCDQEKVAHNAPFDLQMAAIGFARSRIDPAPFDQLKSTCTMQAMRAQLPPKSPVNLKACFHLVTGTELIGAHDALIDTQACRKVFWYTRRGDLLNG